MKRDETYLYKDNETDLYMIHDIDVGFDYAMSKFDIQRNINIQKNLTGVAKFYNAHLEDNGDIVLLKSNNYRDIG